MKEILCSKRFIIGTMTLSKNVPELLSKQLYFDNPAFPKFIWLLKLFFTLDSLTMRKTFWEMLISRGLSVSDITYFSKPKFFDSRCSLNIPHYLHPVCPSACSIKAFPQDLCQHLLWQKQCFVLSDTSPVLGTQREHTFQRPSQLLWGHVINSVLWNMSEMK